MLHFVIATDFSPVARNATHYACAMAAALNASITLAHTYIVPMTYGMDMPLPVMPIDEAREIADERMTEIVSHLREAFPSLSIQGELIYGEAVEGLEDYLSRTNPDLVFLGNSGSGNTDLWMGSTVVSALRRLPHTLIAIPEEAQYRPVRNIAFACDYEHLDESLPKEQLNRLLAVTGARLHVVSIFKSVGESSGKTDPAVFSDIGGDARPTLHSLVADQVDEGIRKFATEHDIDWIVVAPQKHSFIEGLFHRSHTKAMVRMSELPLAAIHKTK